MQVGHSAKDVYAHKIELIGYAGHFSAWYTLEGALTDGARFDRLGRAYPLTPKMRTRLTKAWSLISYYAWLNGAPVTTLHSRITY